MSTKRCMGETSAPAGGRAGITTRLGLVALSMSGIGPALAIRNAELRIWTNFILLVRIRLCELE